MRTRLLSALVGIPLVLAAVFLAGPRLFGAIALALGVLALDEYLRLCAVERRLRLGIPLVAVAAALALAAGRPGTAAVGAVAAVVALAIAAVGDPAVRLRGVAESALGVTYIGFAVLSLWFLATGPSGRAWVLLVLLATWAGDSEAYFIGTRFGRHRLAPVLSPKKSWEGALAGLAGSLAGALAALPAFPEGGLAPLGAALAGIAVGVAGQAGDAFESLWKRAKGVKDSGTLIPGHGGILDRIDSLLLAFPVARVIAERWGS